jgi:siderophore synthetase component
MIATTAWHNKKKKRKGYNSLDYFSFAPEMKEKRKPFFLKAWSFSG